MGRGDRGSTNGQREGWEGARRVASVEEEEATAVVLMRLTAMLNEARVGDG
jgi:hypothetical protein